MAAFITPDPRHPILRDAALQKEVDRLFHFCPQVAVCLLKLIRIAPLELSCSSDRGREFKVHIRNIPLSK